jgi:hypothetical protein
MFNISGVAMVIREGKYSLVVWGVPAEDVERAVTGLPVTVRHQPRKGRVLVVYAGDARSVAGYYEGIRVIKEARLRLQEAASGKE